MASNYKLNVFTGELDITVQSPNYVATFSTPTSWGSPSAGNYTLTVPVATHGKGQNPIVQILELSGPNYVTIAISHTVDPSGNIIIQVSETPDLRFNGKIIVAENN